VSVKPFRPTIAYAMWYTLPTPEFWITNRRSVIATRVEGGGREARMT
jgi:hypothetical protein